MPRMGMARLAAAAFACGSAALLAAHPYVPAASAASTTGAHGALARCGGNMPALPWWSTGVANCSYWGRPGARISYSWHSAKGDPYNAVQVYGFDAHGKGRWYGCGWAASGRCSVPWGNYIATPRARAMNRVHADHIYYSVP
ncbi:MAG TPA: hypothetical protein VF069_01105 [Streptosporangiaceae bacterium]